jgi:chemotaxis protein methyltransferase CheR
MDNQHSLEMNKPGEALRFAGPASSLSDRDFHRLSSFIERELGIKMPPAKRIMLESRLSRRLRQHGFTDYTKYVDYVFSDEGARTELIHMIDAVTTNKTDFFREADHFDYLLNELLPKVCPKGGMVFKVWSAGCSTGEEPYTLSMVLEEYRRVVPAFHWSLLATDISTKVLGQAMEAVYDEEKVAPVPYDYKKRYLLKSKDPAKRLVRVKPELRGRIEFRRLNFMDEDFGIREKFDVIFCRNVIIYFDRPTQEKLIRKFYDLLLPGGSLFLGHSETLTGMNIQLRSAAPTVYTKA